MSAADLDALMEALIQAVLDAGLDAGLGITEGRVATVGPPPYRRLDCDGRALAYMRIRARAGAVRIDLGGAVAH